MEAREETKRDEFEEEEEFDDNDDGECSERKRKWWKRAYGLLMRSESGIEEDSNYNDRRNIVVVSRLDRLVIHPDNW